MKRLLLAVGLVSLVVLITGFLLTSDARPQNSQPSKPSVTLSLLANRESLRIDSKYLITWQSEDAPAGSSVFLQVIGIKDGQPSWGYGLGNNTFPASGSYYWVPERPGEYRIMADLIREGFLSKSGLDRRGVLASAETDVLQVRPSDQPTNMRIVWPNGRERLFGGRKYQVKWTTTGIPSNATFRVGHMPAEQSSEVGSALIATTRNTGILEWTVPETIDWRSTAQCHDVTQGDGGGELYPSRPGVIVSVPWVVEIVWVSSNGVYRAVDISDEPFVLTAPCGG